MNNMFSLFRKKSLREQLDRLISKHNGIEKRLNYLYETLAKGGFNPIRKSRSKLLFEYRGLIFILTISSWAIFLGLNDGCHLEYITGKFFLPIDKITSVKNLKNGIWYFIKQKEN